MTAWKNEKIRHVTGIRIEHTLGWTYNHLGFFQSGVIPFHRWTVIHINSGHQIASVDRGSLEGMKAMVAEIADAGDWSFDGLEGFKNQFPDAAERTHEIVIKHRPELRRRPTGTTPNAAAARTVAMLREDEQVAEIGKQGDTPR